MIYYLILKYNLKNEKFLTELILKEKYTMGVTDLATESGLFVQITRALTSEHLLKMLKEKMIKSCTFLRSSREEFECKKFIIAVYVPSIDMIDNDVKNFIKLITTITPLFSFFFAIPSKEVSEMRNIFPPFFKTTPDIYTYNDVIVSINDIDSDSDFQTDSDSDSDLSDLFSYNDL